MTANLRDYESKDVVVPTAIRSRTTEDVARPAALSDFADWLLAAGEQDRISCAHLRALYAEFAMFSDTPPFTEARFFRGLKAAGIVRKREGTGARKWYYAVRRRQASAKNFTLPSQAELRGTPVNAVGVQ